MVRVEQAAAAVAAARAAYADATSLATASRQEIVDLLALTAELSRLVDAQQVRLAGAIAERSKGADDESVCRLLGARSPREAIASAFGVRVGDASELLSMAAATTATTSLTGQDIPIKYPRVAAAIDDGELSFAQARAIVTTLAPAEPNADLTQLAWAEGCLVDAATDPAAPLAPELLVTQARAYVAVLDPDGLLPNDERHRTMRSLRVWQQRDGGWRISGYSPPEDGSILNTLLAAYTSPRTRVRFADAEDCATDPSGSNVGESNAGEVDARRVEAAGRAGAAVDADDRTPQQKRHDVLIALAKAHAASGDAPVAGGEAPRLVLNGTIEAFDAYVRGIDHPDRALTVEHTGAIVPIETADRLLCDGVVQRAVVDSEGHVLNLGREQRTFSHAQRRALAVQYRGCATPGCGLPVAWTEAHHVTWWRNGGPTDLDNGILLCSHCHHEVHAGRLLVVGTAGHWRVTARLRPTDRYVRNRRRRAAGPRMTVAHSAAPPLAVKLPEPTAPSVGRTRRAVESVEARVRRRFPAVRPPRHRTPAVDRCPSQHTVLRI